MEIIMLIALIVIGIVIVLAFFSGNIMIIEAVYTGTALDWEEYWILILIAVAADIILLCIIIAKIVPHVSASFQLMRNGLKNRRIMKRESAKLKKLLKSEEPDVNRLRELRDKRISEDAMKRTSHFCQLIETVAGKERLQGCLDQVRERQSVLDEINDIESKIFAIAENCKNAGDVEKFNYYLDILKAEKTTPEVAFLEEEFEEQRNLRKLEKVTTQMWGSAFLIVLAFLLMIFAVLYVEDAPNRELHSMIKDQTLTAELCSWDNRDSEESYYNYLTSLKGRKFLASELTRLHKEGDVGKAMWLLCIQPNSIDHYLYPSPSFVKWIVGYARHNGVRSVKRIGRSRNYVSYSVDGYEIIVDKNEDEEDNIDNFTISDGENKTTVDSWIMKDNMPVIE